MAEEQHRCQAPPEGHRLCVNNCGFFGSPATMNLCSKCYRDLGHGDQSLSPSLPLLIPSSSSSSSSSAVVAESRRPVQEAVPEEEEEKKGKEVAAVAVPFPAAKAANRCASCRKRVGLTGFRCRCGDTFCGAHRYPEKHSCGFDFKKAGREEIARANPLVVADKLQRI